MSATLVGLALLGALLIPLPSDPAEALPTAEVRMVVELPVPEGYNFDSVGPFTATGTAVDQGVVCGAGTSTDLFGEVVSDQGGTVALRLGKRFTCDDGSGSFDVELLVDLNQSATEGTWSVVSGTGTYPDLQGGGTITGERSPTNPIIVIDTYTGELYRETGLTEEPDLAHFDPARGKWHLRYGDGTVDSFFYGTPGDVPLMGDWDCDSIDTVAMYRPSSGFIYLRNSNEFGVGEIEFFYGMKGDVPIAGDWDGDGCDTFGIFRRGRVFVSNQLGTRPADVEFFFGISGDRPFAGDFDGDGIDTIGLYRDSTGFVYFTNTIPNRGGIAPTDNDFYYGVPSDRIVVGDWDGDGDDSVGIFRPTDGRFYLSLENRQGFADMEIDFGEGAWLPTAGYFGAPPPPPAASVFSGPVSATGGLSGNITFEVSPDGQSVKDPEIDFTLDDFQCNGSTVSGSGNMQLFVTIPVIGDSFSHVGSISTFQGRFQSPTEASGTASGTLDLSTERSCPWGPLAWTATRSGTEPSPTTTTTMLSPPTTSTTLGPPPGLVTFADGIYLIPDEVPAGTYRNTDSSGGCYWARLSGFGGGLDEIIANEFTYSIEIVTIDPTDTGFESERCGTWSNDLSPRTSSPFAPFGEGVFQVGSEVAAGTWRNDDSSQDCYWERLSGFSGELGDIIVNEFSDAIQTVAIQESDVGFSSERCGTWTMIGG